MAQINKPNQYFNTKLYTGNGSSGHAITGVGFQPDFTWIKKRSTTGTHSLFDVVRGVEKRIRTDDTAAEDTSSNYLSSFNADGFTVNNDAGTNQDTITLASWNWLGANGTAANTDGTISSTVSANTTSGFSIVKFTGTGANATVGHGLGVAPSMILFKNYSSANNWLVYNKNLGATKFLYLNVTDAEGTDTGHFNNTEPTSSVFTVGTANGTNKNAENIIAYCFAEKQGYSKFGSYTGNGSTDGTFVYTGFKPAYVLIKKTSGTAQWKILDNKRDTFNVVDALINASNSGAESTFTTLDFTSNGFKMRNSDADMNGSGETYIYMAFAENPLVGTNNIPATAR